MEEGDIFTELGLVTIVDEFRYEQMYSLGNSFQTIVAFGPNGAHPHYEPSESTNSQIFDNSTLVIDSGGQYYGKRWTNFKKYTQRRHKGVFITRLLFTYFMRKPLQWLHVHLTWNNFRWNNWRYTYHLRRNTQQPPSECLHQSADGAHPAVHPHISPQYEVFGCRCDGTSTSVGSWAGVHAQHGAWDRLVLGSTRM